VALIASYQVVGARLVCTFEKNVIAGVAGGLDRVGRRYDMGVAPNEFEKLPAEAFGNAQLRARQDHKIFGKNWSGDVEPGRLRKGEQENGALQTFRSGLSAAKTMMFVSTTSRSGSISASLFARAPS